LEYEQNISKLLRFPKGHRAILKEAFYALGDADEEDDELGAGDEAKTDAAKAV